MRRREFIALSGGAAVIACRAWAQERVRRLGVLMGYEAADEEARQRVKAFKQRLEALGWIEGRTISFDDRWVSGDAQHIRSNAAALVASYPDLIVASSTPVLRALLQERATFPSYSCQSAIP
jgi:putative tryptophan/tyrosine transport system substrate-binding protein